MAKLTLVVLSLGALLVTAGCGSSGPELATVSGTVKMDGAPLADASVQFVPVSGRPSYGSTDANGYYELEFTAAKSGAVPGEHTVRVSTHRRADPDSGAKGQPERIPTKYNSKSEIKKTVNPGKNTIDIEVSEKDGKVVQPTGK
jgi:hypothetical protein